MNLLDAGHRAGKGIVRCSSLQSELKAASKALVKGDATPLAKIAPTSLVFGVRTLAAPKRRHASHRLRIRAYDVKSPRDRHSIRRRAAQNPITVY